MFYTSANFIRQPSPLNALLFLVDFGNSKRPSFTFQMHFILSCSFMLLSGIIFTLLEENSEELSKVCSKHILSSFVFIGRSFGITFLGTSSKGAQL